MDGKKFNVIATVNISENKQLVFSENYRGEYVLAQRAVVNDNGKEKYYYDKGSVIFKEEFAGDIPRFVEEIKKYFENL